MSLQIIQASQYHIIPTGFTRFSQDLEFITAQEQHQCRLLIIFLWPLTLDSVQHSMQGQHRSIWATLIEDLTPITLLLCKKQSYKRRLQIHITASKNHRGFPTASTADSACCALYFFLQCLVLVVHRVCSVCFFSCSPSCCKLLSEWSQRASA